MAGSYCKFCDERCFVLRVIPDGPRIGKSLHLATCTDGMAYDFEATGYTHETAINPYAEPEAAAAILAARLSRCPDKGACHHECPSVAACFRVAFCGPLSGVFPDDTWPEGVSAAARAARDEMPERPAEDYIVAADLTESED